jgi:hypothetical protein
VAKVVQPDPRKVSFLHATPEGLAEPVRVNDGAIRLREHQPSSSRHAQPAASRSSIRRFQEAARL